MPQASASLIRSSGEQAGQVLVAEWLADLVGELAEERDHRPRAALSLGAAGGGEQGGRKAEQLGEEVIHRVAAVVQRPVLGPRIAGVEELAPEADARGDAAEDAQRAQRLQAVG